MNPPINSRIEFDEIIVPKVQDWVATNPNRGLDSEEFQKQYAVWSDEAAKTVRARAREDALSQMFDRKVGGVQRIDNEDGTSVFATDDESASEFADLYSEAYYNGDSETMKRLKWDEWQKNKFSKPVAMARGFLYEQAVAFEEMAAGISAWAFGGSKDVRNDPNEMNAAYYGGAMKRASFEDFRRMWESSERKFAEDLADQLEMTGERRSKYLVDRFNRDWSKYQSSVEDPYWNERQRLADIKTEQARFAGREVAGRIRAIGTLGRHGGESDIARGDIHDPTDPRKTQGRAGGGFFVKAAEMTGTATGVIPYSLPAMATRNPKAAFLMTTPFYSAAAQGAYDDRLDIHRQQVAKAQELGLPEPAAPLRADVANYARATGLIELASEYTIDRLQLATLKGLMWGSKVKGTSLSPSQLQQAGAELAMSMQRRRGLTGTAKGVGRFAAVAAQEGVEEAVPAIGQEVLDPIFIPEGYQSDFWSWQTAEEVGVGTIAGALMAGGYTALGKQPRQQRRQTAAIRKAIAEGKADFVGPAMKGRATRLGIERLAANSGRAMTEQMALAQLHDIERGRRTAMVISPADADRVITPRVAEQMQVMGVTARGQFGQGFLYAQQAVDADVRSAAAAGDTDFLFGRPTMVEPNIPLAGAFVVRNAGGQIIDVMPYTDGNIADGIESSVASDVQADGLTYSRVDGDAVADVESEMARQMEAQAVASGAVKAGPRQPNEVQRRRGVNSLTKEIGESVQGSLNDGPARQREETDEQFAAREAAWSDAPYQNPMLSKEELGGARNRDVKVDVVITEVPESALTGAEKLVSTTTGVKPTVLDAVVRFTIANPDGTTRVVEKSTDQDGAYLAQDSTDGVFLIRDTTGNPFTRRNAFVTALHEVRHRMGATSRAGAEYLGHLFWLDPEFALRGGIGYMMQNPRFARDAAGLSEDEIVGRVSAAYGAALAVLEDKAGYAKAQRTLKDDDASAVEVEQAQSRVREQEEAIETVKEVETFAEESVAATQTEGLGQVSELAAEFETHYKNRRERSARAFMAWMSHVLSRNGYDGPQGQQAIYEIGQRHSGKVDSEMQVHAANRREAERRFKESFRRWQAQRPQQPASTATAPAAAGGVAAKPENAERGLAGGASFSRRPSKGASKVVGAVGKEEREQGLAEATDGLTEAQRNLSEATTPEARSSALAGVVQALAKYMPYLADASAQVGVTSKRVRGPQAAPPSQQPRATAEAAQQPQAESALFGEVARPRADVKASGRRTLRGEWWLTEGGPLFADGDVGDMNHEMLAQEQAVVDLRDELLRYEDSSLSEIAKTRISNFAKNIEFLIDNEGYGDKKTQVAAFFRAFARDNGQVVTDGVYDFWRELRGEQDDAGWTDFALKARTALGKGDAREYGFNKGWVRVQRNNIQLRGITDSALRGVADNLYQAEDEAVLDQVFTIEDVATRRMFEDVPFEALEKGISGLAPYRAQYSLRPIKRSEMTPEMATWSEGSKVVDENGDLIPVYHGTADEFDEFRGDMGRRGPRGSDGLFYFSKDPADASMFAESRQIDIVGNIGITQFTREQGGARVIPAVLSAKNLFDSDNKEHVRALKKYGIVEADIDDGHYENLEAQRVLDAIYAAGFDGMYVRESDNPPTPAKDRDIAVFNRNQIKGYFNDRPTSSPKIMGSRRKSTGGPIEAAKTRVETMQRVAFKDSETFFKQAFPDMLRRTRMQLKPDSKNFREAARRAVSDVASWIKDNQRFSDYYETDWKATRSFLEDHYGRPITQEEMKVARFLAGVTSPNTGLPSNVADMVMLTDHWIKNGNFDAFRFDANQYGNPKGVDGPYTISGNSAPNKLKVIKAVEMVARELGSWDAALKYMMETDTIKNVSAKKQTLGYKGGVGKVGIVRRVVKTASGTDSVVPRMFMFGPKVGAYTMNALGDSRYTTVDIWESRFIRAYFKGMFEENTGLPTDDAEHDLFVRFSEIFNEEWKKATGIDMEPSGLQASRWFYIIDATKRLGYSKASTNETISNYTERVLQERLGYRGTSQEGGRRGDGAAQAGTPVGQAVADQSGSRDVGVAESIDPLGGGPVVSAQFSMRRGAAGIKDEATGAFIDRFDELLRAQRVAERTSGALADPANPYLGARLLQGNIAAQQQEAERRYADLLRRQHVAGIAIDEMDEFLYAQHAKERNDYIAGIDPAMPDGGSGMTNSDAADIIAEAQRRGRFAEMNAFAEEWREMLRAALDARLAAGLIRRDVYDAVTATYKNYVPLRGRAARDPWDADFEEVAPTYARGLSTTGRGMPQATGRRSAATGISAQVAYVHEDTIRRIARNDVGQRFLRLTQVLADRRWTEVVRPTRRVVVGGAVRVVHDPSWTQDGRHFGVFLADAERIGGHDYAAGDLVVIRINNERLARAMLEPTMDLRWWERGLRVANNVWRMMTTGPLNPAFAPVNQMRDLGTATINNTLQRGAIDTLGMLRRYPRTFIRVMADEWNGQGPTGTYREFTEAGGQQVYWRENELDVKQTDFDALARRVARRDPNDRGLAKEVARLVHGLLRRRRDGEQARPVRAADRDWLDPAAGRAGGARHHRGLREGRDHEARDEHVVRVLERGASGQRQHPDEPHRQPRQERTHGSAPHPPRLRDVGDGPRHVGRRRGARSDPMGQHPRIREDDEPLHLRPVWKRKVHQGSDAVWVERHRVRGHQAGAGGFGPHQRLGHARRSVR
jgi:hypothetical protein